MARYFKMVEIDADEFIGETGEEYNIQEGTMTYNDRLAIFESQKAQIAKEAKTPQEYERRIKALAKRLNI